MKTNRFSLLAFCAAAGAATTAMAQDSVSTNSNGGNGLPGDGLNVWSTSSQSKAYALDLVPLFTSCGTRFGVAPLIKSSKTGSLFFGSLTSAYSMSQTSLSGVELPAATYSEWIENPGAGVNTGENSAGELISPTLWTPYRSNQFGAVVAEFATSDFGVSVEQVITAVANFDPARPSRLWVNRVVAANNAPNDSAGNEASLGVGTVDANGNTYFRADNNNNTMTGSNPIQGNNIFRVDTASRGASVNLISNAGGGDAGATDWIVAQSTFTYNVPNNVPQDLGGPRFIGSNTNKEYVREGGSNTTDHRPNTTDHRGAISFTSIPHFGGVGTSGMIGVTANGSDSLSLWAVNADGSIPTGKAYTLTRPASITDPIDPFTATSFVFDHYRSQTLFKGGSGQVAVGRTLDGQGLAAATMYSSGAAQNPYNAVAVVRFNPSNPTASPAWTIVGWNNPNTLTGKKLMGDWGADGIAFTGDAGEFDGVCDALDAPIGRLASLFEIPGAPAGPSMSAPVFDAAGNVWFLSAAAINKDFDNDGNIDLDFDSVLIRGVYDASINGYNLELVMELGDTFSGKNSGVQYQVQFLEIADSNSVASGTMWSNSGRSGAAWNNLDTSALPTDAPQHLGGLVLAAGIVYDSDFDGDFTDPTGASNDPDSADEAYNVLLYIGNVQKACAADFNADGFATGDDFDQFIAAFEQGDLAADFIADGFVTGDDFDAFNEAFSSGCE